MSLAEIVVDQLVFVLRAPEDVLAPDAAIDLLQTGVSALAELSAAEYADVRRTADERLAAGSAVPGVVDALRELVLLLDEIEAE